MPRYGLIGEKLGHSFSKPIHEQLTGEPYTLYPLSREDFPGFMNRREFDAINVTIPYKQEVIPYCGFIDERAKKIGAVNTIVNEGGILRGYNTDYDGFGRILDSNGFSGEGKKALVLGGGGTSKTVRTVLLDRGVGELRVVSRSPGPGEISYQEALGLTDTELIVNTTPVGMFPHTEEQPLSLSGYKKLAFVIDVIYNPLRTRLLQQAEELGIPNQNGLLMLVAQAKYAAERFRGICLPEKKTGEVWQSLYEQKRNLVLTGMPVSGKTTLGRKLSAVLNKRFVDTDEEIERRAGETIPSLFQRLGEKGFRKLEQETIKELSVQNGLVLSTGGGAILDMENVQSLRQNGFLLFIDRPLSLLTVGKGRPLAKSPEEIAALYEQRYPLYLSRCDGRIQNDCDEKTALVRALEACQLDLN